MEDKNNYKHGHTSKLISWGDEKVTEEVPEIPEVSSWNLQQVLVQSEKDCAHLTLMGGMQRGNICSTFQDKDQIKV